MSPGINWTNLIAIYAGIVSTTALILQFIFWHLSQPRIKIQIEEVLFLNEPPEKRKNKIMFKVINAGDKYIVLHERGFFASDNSFLIITQEAVKLEGRNCDTVYVDKDKIIGQAKFPLIAIVTDAIGNKYHSKPSAISSSV